MSSRSEYINGIWKTLKRFINDFKEFAKKEEVAKIKAMVEMANNFNLAVDKHDTEELLEELLEVVPEQLTD